ncbi:MAG: hypothetical protein EAX86_07410 [Candidatus Heimdallarchaeota archaeon]|nr:hypothetical protein [Candidatus Heimdallarchaeota archaeon]
MVGTDSIENIARESFRKCPPELAFRFYGSNGKIIASTSNLSELISTLPEIPATIAQFHVYRETTQGIFDEPAELDGPVVRSDLALWINYVLGDIELSRCVYELGKEFANNPEELKQKVIEVLKEREQELIRLIKA